MDIATTDSLYILAEADCNAALVGGLGEEIETVAAPLKILVRVEIRAWMIKILTAQRRSKAYQGQGRYV